MRITDNTMDPTRPDRNAGAVSDAALTPASCARLANGAYARGVVRGRALPGLADGSKPVRRSPGFLQRGG